MNNDEAKRLVYRICVGDIIILGGIRRNVIKTCLEHTRFQFFQFNYIRITFSVLFFNTIRHIKVNY